jgi:hypothetical protein
LPETKQEEDDNDSDIEIIPETDADRRVGIISVTAPDELEQMKFSPVILSQNNFIWPVAQKKETPLNSSFLSRRSPAGPFSHPRSCPHTNNQQKELN